MISLIEAKIIKTETTKNYNIDDYRNPPKKFTSKFRRKVVFGKDGQKHIITFAIMNRKGKKRTGVNTKVTSIWHQK